MSTPMKFEDPADIKWKWRAEVVQQYYCDSLSDRTWELYEEKEYVYVAKKVAFAIFGLPRDDNNEEIGLEGYDHKQREIAHKIKAQIINLKPAGMDLQIAFLFIACKMGDKEFPEPVFRVLQTTTEDGIDTASYVDINGRIYNNWELFLANNLLPECIFCYPERGYYEYNEEGFVRIAYAQSPACSLSQKVRRLGDTAGTALSFICAGIGVATLFTPVAPIVAVGALATGTATGVYGGFRGAETVYDRKTHGQSISFADSEARGVWLNIAATALGTIAGAANAALLASAKAGEVFSKSARAAINVLNISNVSVNGVVIADRLVYMVDKYKHGKLTTLDILQFSTSVFFFTNSLISIKTARMMIKDAQAEIIHGQHEALSPNELVGVKPEVRLAQNEVKSTMYENGRVIKRIVKVDTDKASPTVTRPLNLAGDENDEQLKVALLLPTGGMISSPSEQHLMPVTQTQNGPTRMFQVFQYIFGSGGVGSMLTPNNVNAAARKLDVVLRDPHTQIFRESISKFLDKAYRAFKSRKWNELEINGHRIFDDLHPFEQANLGSTMGAEGNNFDPEITDAAMVFARKQKCKNATEFVQVVDQVNTYVTQNKPDERKQLLTQLKNSRSDAFKELTTRYETQANSYTMTYHFCRQENDTREMSQFEEHLKICQELFGEDVNSNNAIFSEASTTEVFVTYVDDKGTTYAIVIEHEQEEQEITHFRVTVSILSEM